MNPLLRKILILNITLSILYLAITFYFWSITNTKTYSTWNPFGVSILIFTRTDIGIWQPNGHIVLPNYPFYIFFITTTINLLYTLHISDKLNQIKEKINIMNPLLRKILIANIILTILYFLTSLYVWSYTNDSAFSSWGPTSIITQYFGYTGTGEVIGVMGINFIPNYPFWIFFISMIVNYIYINQLTDKLMNINSQPKE